MDMFVATLAKIKEYQYTDDIIRNQRSALEKKQHNRPDEQKQVVQRKQNKAQLTTMCQTLGWKKGYRHINTDKLDSGT